MKFFYRPLLGPGESAATADEDIKKMMEMYDSVNENLISVSEP